MPDVSALVAATRELGAEHVLPVEAAHDGDVTAAGGDELRVRLRSIAAAAGLLAPHAPAAYGGLDLGGHAAHLTSVTKIFAAEAIDRPVGCAQQLCGGLGAAADLPVARLARVVRVPDL